MKSVRPLTEFENFDICNTELISVFHAMYPDLSAIKEFWTFLDDDSFFAKCPITVAQFKKMGLTVKHCYMISIVDEEHGTIHTDYRADPVRIHWPVLNADSVLTSWYDFDGNLSDCPIKTVDIVGPPYVEVDESRCTIITEHMFKGPTAFRVDIPHSATAILGQPLPRVAFSFTFQEQDLVNSLLL